VVEAMIVRHIVGLAGTVAALLAASSFAGPAASLRVRATEALHPCAVAAARAFAATGGGAVTVEVGALDDATADVLLGSSFEMTRALEAGLGRDDSDVALAEIPWVLVLAERAPVVASLEEAARAGLEIGVWSGPDASDARRALSARTIRASEGRDASTLRKAEAALLPLSLAGPGRRIRVDIPALVAQAALGARSSAPESARKLLAYLGGEAGQRAFSDCGVEGR
jgi:hypothetical protein